MDFVKTGMGVRAALGATRSLAARSAARNATARVIGANDRINIGFIGVGVRGNGVMRLKLCP